MKNNNTLVGLLVVVIIIGIGFLYTQHKGIEGDATIISKEDTQALLVGTWQSMDDEKYYMVYGSDGLMADIYDGEELARGAWEVLPGDDEKIRVTQGAEVFEYSITDLNAHELMMIYLGRGNILRYRRIETNSLEE